MKYIKGCKKLTFAVDNLCIIEWCVDASYNVHKDCKSHTGAMMSLGSGAITSFSQKWKLNVKNSSEAELVRINDAMPSIL